MNARLQIAPAGRHLVIDDIHDLALASDGFSRFGACLARRLPAVIDGDPHVLTDPVRWAAFAWASATTPVMSPGYVDWNGPIEDIQAGWDDGNLTLEAVVRSQAPMSLPGWQGWDRDRKGDHIEPWDGSRTALTRITLRVVLVDVELPSPPGELASREDIVFAAKASVGLIALAAEDVLGPVVDALTLSEVRTPMNGGVGR